MKGKLDQVSENVLDRFLTEKILKLAIEFSLSFSSVLLAIIVVLINRYNVTSRSCISILSAPPETSNVIRFDIRNNSLLSLANDINKVIGNSSAIPDDILSGNHYIEVGAWFKYANEIANLLDFNKSDLDKQFFAATVKTNVRIKFISTYQVLKLIVTTDQSLMEIFNLDNFNKNLIQLTNILISNPQSEVVALDFLCEEEVSTLQSYSQSNYHLSRPVLTIHKYFEQVVDLYSENMALVLEGIKLSYQELNARANQLAHYIRQKYFKVVHHELVVNTPIGICLDRSIDLIIAILAVLKSGGCYVPLDPNYPRERLKFIINDCQIEFLISRIEYLQRLDAGSLRFINISDEMHRITKQAIWNPKDLVQGDNLAYIIYTSGSTGQPKGVKVPHAGVCNMILWTKDYYPISHNDRIIQIASFAFDLSVWEIFSGLLSGGCLVLTLPVLYKDVNYLLDVMIKNKITILGTVPSLLRQIMSSPKIKQVKSLKQVLSCGEPLTMDICETFFALSKAKFYNGYGPTETTIMATHWLCNKENSQSRILLGRPIANTFTWVLDQNKNKVPVGVVGELYISGIGVTVGYVNRKELTQKLFVRLPLNSMELFYRTGDLVRWLADGNLEFMGRADQQIKLRGYRIELGEIENFIKQNPDIKDCVVILKEINSVSHLIAYIVLPPNILSKGYHVSILKKYLAQYLPDYMIPTYFVKMMHLPLNDNGKIDRANLPIPKLKDRFSKVI